MLKYSIFFSFLKENKINFCEGKKEEFLIESSGIFYFLKNEIFKIN
jgi:hypothetical protein